MSSFGRLFRVTTFGESHCTGVGVIVDGVPPRMCLTEADVQPQLTRRRPGQSDLTTARKEADEVLIWSGTECGLTLGTPICMTVKNNDHRPNDYGSMRDIPRPSHADYTYEMQHGIRASSGGGRASARETIGRVAASGIAEKWLRERYGIEIVAWVSRVYTISADRKYESADLTRADIDKNDVRCPDPEAAQKMAEAIKQAKRENDSIGGVVTCVCRNVPAGWGEPVFDKLSAMLARAMMSIPATKGFEIGSGFNGIDLKGSEHNDMFYQRNDGRLGTKTNNSGGIQGGISNGERIVMRLAFKPPATISKSQHTADFDGKETELKAEGRHDPCVVPRAIPIVEAMAALVLADAAMLQESRIAVSSLYPPVGKVTRARADEVRLLQQQQLREASKQREANKQQNGGGAGPSFSSSPSSPSPSSLSSHSSSSPASSSSSSSSSSQHAAPGSPKSRKRSAASASPSPSSTSSTAASPEKKSKTH